MFYHCPSLQYLLIPDCVNLLGTNAFIYCSNLRYVVMSSDITSIGTKIFVLVLI